MKRNGLSLFFLLIIPILFFGCSPKIPENMTPEVEQKIIEAYVTAFYGEEQAERAEYERISVTCVYILPDAYAVYIEDAGLATSGFPLQETVNGLTFTYNGSLFGLEIYHDGALYSLSTAFENEIISAEDVTILHNCYESYLRK